MVRRMSGKGVGHIFWHLTQTELMNEASYLTSQTHVAFRHSHPLSRQNIKLINFKLTNSPTQNAPTHNPEY